MIKINCSICKAQYNLEDNNIMFDTVIYNNFVCISHIERSVLNEQSNENIYENNNHVD
jgi:transcription elongation factor Elf1